MLKKILSTTAALAIATSFFLPSVASAAALNPGQIQAIVGLLQAFNVDQAIITQVQIDLGDSSVAVGGQAGTPNPSTPTTPPVSTYVPPIGSIYPSSAIGYDLSFGTTAYPVDRFGFAVVGVTRGKAFVDNTRLASEFSWAHFASAVQPTIYMNLNAPYGSTVAGHTSSPKSCPTPADASGEPTVCAGYNYGYQAAMDAYGYTKESSVSAPFWWLDIEEANSWSTDVTVNDATIQGAIDYLNTQGIRVGVYSTGYMWNEIAGSSFIPTETLNGKSMTVPTWLPIGITSQVGAINSCVTRTSFISGSPIWIVQYESSSTAIDQNLSC